QAEEGIVFAVRRVEADYLAPARLQDELDVTTGLVGLGGARIDLIQEVRRGGTLLFTAGVRGVLDPHGPLGPHLRLVPLLRPRTSRIEIS
ncbi:hypothetical protein CNY89_24835, partial [Amaricoccus sp. HAR-UPW-R2A-40]